MRYITLLLVAVACAAPAEKFAKHGADITPNDAISVDSFLSEVNDQEQVFKVRATIEEVCQMKGCWMTLKSDSESNIRVTFKDYGFFVPKDISGREVVIEGVAKREVLEEDIAKHYADDEGKEYDESMRNTVTFVASGVLVKESQS